MLNLFLSEPDWDHDDDSVEMRVSLLNKLESVIWSVFASGGRSEARLWLCNNIAGITSVTPRHQRELFFDLLSANPLDKRLATQLLHMMFDNRPQMAGSIIAKRSYALRKFFRGNPTRISRWFSKTGPGLGQGKGASALSHFAFVNRDNFWEELEWKGKHGQSPAVVATKPHYFLDLDVQQTVENFLKNVPEFWSSDEFSDSLTGGEILAVDINFFVLYFLDLMYKEDAGDVWDVINEFLEEEHFSSLCKHLLITLEESDLCEFLKMLHKHLKPRVECKDPLDSSYLFEVVVSKCSDCGCFDQILLLNAVFTYGRQLLRLLRDEGTSENLAKLKDIVSEICEMPGNNNSMGPIIKGGSKLKIIDSFRLMGLQSWVIFYSLSDSCQTPQSWESLFTDNAISFRKYDKYLLLHDDETAEGGSDLDYRASKKVKHRKKSSRSKRKRDFDHDDNELLDFDTNRLDMQSSARSWLLSLDGYSASWTSADLPEYLSNYCLSRWIKWAVKQGGY